jgi:hypothetical protein
MIKGVRVEATNAYTVNGGTAYNMITIPTGKTFVLTDLIAAGTYAGDENAIKPQSHDALRLYDYAAAVSTDASVVATARLNVHLNTIDNATTMTPGTAMTIMRTGVVLHLTNGPEFSNGVCPQMGGGNNTVPIGTGCLWLAGYIR